MSARSLRDLATPKDKDAKPETPAHAAAEPPAADTRKHRTGKRAFTTHIWEADYKTLKRAAFENDTNVQALVDEALTLLFRAKGYEKHKG